MSAPNQQQQTFSEWWNEYWSRQPFPSGYTQSSITLLACFLSTIMILIVVGNLLVCIAIFTEKSLKPTQNWFIASLAVSDLLLGLVVMPFSLARELMGFWLFGQLWCDIHEALDVLLSTASINTLCLISLDRYWSITQAVKYLKKRTPRRGALMIAFVWFFSAAVSLPPLFGWKKQHPSATTATTTATTNSTHQTATNQQQAQLPIDKQQQLAWEDEPTSTSTRKRRKTRQNQFENYAIPILPDHDELNQHYQHRNKQLRGLIQYNQQGGVPSIQLVKFDQQQPMTHLLASNLLSETRPFSDDVAFIDEPKPTAAPNQAAATDPSVEYPTCQLSDDVGYVLYSALGSFYIPCAVMVFTYIKIFLAARSRARRAIQKQNRQNAALANSQNRQMNGQTGRNRSQQIEGHHTGGAGAAKLSMSGQQQQQQAAAVDENNNQRGASKIVIVERKKYSIATSQDVVPPMVATASNPAAAASAEELLNSKNSIHPVHVTSANANSATYTCAELISERQRVAAATATHKSDTLGDAHHRQQATLTTSSAKQASPNALSPSGDDSSKTSGCGVSLPPTDSGTEQNKAAALLKVLSQAGEQGDLLEEAATKGLLASSDKTESETLMATQEGLTPNIVIHAKETTLGTAGAPDSSHATSTPGDELNVSSSGTHTTSGTCFMTIDEDSDMYDAQAGRTIHMVSGSARRLVSAASAPSGAQSKVTGAHPIGGSSVTVAATTTTTSTATDSGAACPSSSTCRRAQRRADQSHRAKQMASFCGSSMSINDDDDDADDDEDVIDDDEDEDDDESVDDEMLTDECNGYSANCAFDQYSPGASSCPHCLECEQERCLAASSTQNSSDANNRHLSGTQCDSPARLRAQMLLHHNKTKLHKCQMGSETEAQSMTGDENLSLTEYQSENENSSIVGHDVLDATESKPKKQSSGSNQAEKSSGERKKSSIGFRLSRLGSSAPLSNQSGGLLALAASRHQQQVSSAAGGTRNLKALRQNFFLKLNQITAKSAQKQRIKTKKLQSSPLGKSSAQSSGSYEASLDYATTSNVHSTEYHQETTLADGDDYEQQTSGDSSVPKYKDESRMKVHGESADDGRKPSGGRHTSQAKNANLTDKTNSGDTKDDEGVMLLRRDQSGTGKLLGSSSILSSDATSAAAEGKVSGAAHAGDQQAPAKKTAFAAQTNLRKTTPNLGNNGTSGTHQSGSAQSRAYLASDNERHKRKLAKARERRATLILGLIMAAFICSWLPFFTFYVTRALCTSCRDYISPRVESFIFWMGYCNSAINPIIYTIFNRDFRKAFRKILFKCL